MTPPSLRSADAAQLEHWLGQFDAAWTDRSLAEFIARLPPPGTPLRLPVLVELVKRDLLHQWERGRRPRIEGYLHCYPELGTKDTAPAELILAEYEARQRNNAAADPGDLDRRFPNQSKQVHELILIHSSSWQSPRLPAPPADTLAEDVTVSPEKAPAVPAPATVGESPAPPITGDLPERFGHFRIVKKLGQGGMGTVYLARDVNLDRAVALKVPRFSPADGSAVLERFRQEVKAAAALDHPNICPVYEAGCIDGVHFMTMAYVEGKPLSSMVKSGKPWAPRQAALLIRKLALVVHEAHKKGIVHRDLKPSNVMINQRKEPVVMDFGLARRLTADSTRLTVDGQSLGTPAYMAPEQVCGNLDAMGPRCDVYSLGVMLYELLAGRLPFRGAPFEIVAQALNNEPPRPSSFRPGLDPDLEAICLKAMAREQPRRYATAFDFAAALKKWTDSSALPAAEAAAPDVVEVAEVTTLDALPAAAPAPAAKPDSRKVAVLPVNAPARSLADVRPVRAAPAGRSWLKPLLVLFLLGGPLLVGTAAVCGVVVWYGMKSDNRNDPIIAEDVAACEKLLREGKPTKDYIDKVGPGRVPIWRAAAERGSPEAQWLLSRCYQEGAGVEKNPEVAIEWLRKSAAKGNAYAENNLGYCYDTGEGVGRNPKEAVRWYQKAADKGLPIAQRNLAHCYKTGEGLDQDWARAREWYQKAADQSDTEAQYQLGLIYSEGQGLDKPDPEAAAALYRKAADAGHAEAQNDLGRAYADGNGVAKDQKVAAAWYRRAADSGSAAGQGNLGRAYLYGEGVDKSDEEAIRSLEKAVAQNVTYAPHNRNFRWSLGVALNNRAKAYAETRDTRNALKTYHRAAEVNEKLVAEVPHHFIHRVRLGITYEGLGDLAAGSKNYEDAGQWYIKGSDLGNADASKKLADLFEKGQGVSQSADEAKRLRKLAGDQKVKKVTVPCVVKGRPQKVPMEVFITNAFKGNHPLEEEERRLLDDYDATLPKEVKDSFNRLYEISRQNSVSFIELVEYALNNANEEKKPKEAPPPSGNNKESKAADYFREKGATVVVDQSAPAKPVTGLTLYNAAKPLDVLDTVELVMALPERLADLPNLRTLDLSKLALEDDDVRAIAPHIKGVRWLNLERTDVTDAGLKALEALANLESLNVRDTKVTAAGIERLTKALPKVKVTR
jgi:TPR repeat protein/predicted Ser/Thr protein kinase